MIGFRLLGRKSGEYWRITTPTNNITDQEHSDGPTNRE
jgi:hypothetical protein